MPTSRMAVSAAPADLVAGLSLAAGRYTVETVGAAPAVVRMWEGAAAPATSALRDDAPTLVAPWPRTVQVGADPIWVWTDAPTGGAVAVTPAA